MNEKQEELGKLYTLRAGLSVISQNCDAYDAKKAICVNKQLNLDYNYKYKNADSVESKYRQDMFEIESEIINAENELQKAENKIVYTKNNYEKTKRKRNVFLGFIVFFSITIVGVILICEYFISNIGLNAKKAKYAYIEAQEKYETCLKNLEEINETRESKKKLVEQEKAKNYNELYKYNRDEEKFNEFKKDTLNQLESIYNECKLIELTLVSEYRGFLDIRDWGNLDLIIYYYETMRADGLKEALQLLDCERRNNELINSIQRASNEICNTIRSSINIIGDVLFAGFNSLSAQLEAQRVQKMIDLQQINQNISEILNEQTLNNALLAKANISSRQMVEQMKTLNNKLK